MEHESSPALPPLPAGITHATEQANQIVADCETMLKAYQDAYNFARAKCADGSIDESARDDFSGQLDVLGKALEGLRVQCGDLEEQCDESVSSWAQYNRMNEQPADQLLIVDMIAQALPKLNHRKNIFIRFRETVCKALEAQPATQEKAATLRQTVSFDQVTEAAAEPILMHNMFVRYCEARDKALLGFAAYQKYFNIVLNQLSISPNRVLEDTADAKKTAEKGADEAAILFKALKPLDKAVLPAINGYTDNIAEKITQAAESANQLATKISEIRSGIVELATQLNAVWERMAKSAEAQAKSIKKAPDASEEENAKPVWKLDLQEQTKQPKRPDRKAKKGKGKKKKRSRQSKKPVDPEAQKVKADAAAAQAKADAELIAAMEKAALEPEPEPEKTPKEILEDRLKQIKRELKIYRNKKNKQHDKAPRIAQGLELTIKALVTEREEKKKELAALELEESMRIAASIVTATK